MNSLPFCNKTLLNKFQDGLPSLKIQMIKNYIYDLNSDLNVDLPGEEFTETQFALDIKILDYRFISVSLFDTMKIDVVLTKEAIEAERKRRLVAYKDKVNRKEIENLYNSQLTAEDINIELSRMAQDRFNLVEQADLSGLPEEGYLDFSKKFYDCDLKDSDTLLLMKMLYNMGLRFVDGDRSLCNGIKRGFKEDELDQLLSLSVTKEITNPSPIIECFEIDDLKLLDWCISKLADSGLLSHDDIWVYLAGKKNNKFLKYMESKGSFPSHEILGHLNSII